MDFISFIFKNFGIYLFLLISNMYLAHCYIVINDKRYIKDMVQYFRNSLIVISNLFLLLFLIDVIIKNLVNLDMIKYVLIILFIYSILSFVINYFLIKLLSSTFDLYMFDSIFRMNFSVVKEFFATHFKIYYIALLFFFIIISVSFYFIQIQINDMDIKTNIIFIIFVVLCGLYFFKKEKKRLNKLDDLGIEKIFFIKNIMVIYSYFFGNYSITYTNYNKVQDEYKKHYLSRSKVVAKNNIKNIVFILGESLNRNKLGLYGGFLATNPFLSKLLKSKNLVLFSDVIGPYANTNPALSYIYNFANYENISNQKPFYTYLDIVSLFKLASYKTFYLGNQEYIAGYSNMATSVGVQADEYYFCNKDILNPNEVMRKAKPDEILIKALEDMTPSEKNFYIFHLMGNHYDYKLRYTKGFERWGASDINFDSYKNLDIDKKQNIAEYYNAVLYNDYVVYSIYKKYANEDSVIVYCSDHGEAVYDDKTCNVCNHGIIDKTTAEIPFMIMFSDIFKQKHPDIAQMIINSKDKPYMTDDLIHTFCEIAGIEIDEFDSKRSVINSNFDSGRKRMFMGSVDYDIILKIGV